MPLRIALLALTGTLGCAIRPIERSYYYPNLGLELTITTDHRVQEICMIDGAITAWDDGTPVKPGEKAAGCHWYSLKDKRDHIVVTNSCEGAKALPHELGHMDGSFSRRTVDEAYEWPEP